MAQHTMTFTLSQPHGEVVETFDLMEGSTIEIIGANTKRHMIQVDEQLTSIVMPAAKAEVEAMLAEAEAEGNRAAAAATGQPQPEPEAQPVAAKASSK
jgi:regulator of protease activity HflC (stomatin/prohibitin superfamily)